MAPSVSSQHIISVKEPSHRQDSTHDATLRILSMNMLLLIVTLTKGTRPFKDTSTCHTSPSQDPAVLAREGQKKSETSKQMILSFF